MFYLIGLRTDGTMALYDSMEDRPVELDLEAIAKDYHYTQMLLIAASSTGPCTQIARYEYDDKPRVHEVPISTLL